MQTEDTIAAISTAPGHSGIGIVRLSGRDAIKIAAKIFLSARQKKIRKTSSHRMLYGHITDHANKETIDEVLVSVMKAPNTYTREDVVEINSHGGPVPLRRILDLVINAGARLAEPGEFTQRAFLNGRLDLAQAEAVIDVINALTEQSRKTAVSQLKGGLSKKIQSIREELIELAAFVEAYIDFPDEDIEELSMKDMKKRAENIHQALQKLIESSRYGRVLREGLKTAIIGRPNVGKSSLLNALLEHDRAIVTDVPGTTRDVIEEYLNIKGIPVRIMDTAGIRDVKDIAEKEGVKRSLMAMEDADLVILVLDGSEELHKTDKELIEKSGSKHSIIVINKCDLPQKIDTAMVVGARRAVPLQAQGNIVNISAKKETGLDELKIRIAEMVLSGSAEGSAEIVTSARHVHALEKALDSMSAFITTVDKQTSPEFLSVELRDALDAIGDIIGITTTDDILNKIFSSFCIGK
jgi:tRNA modification GTPase